MGGLLKVFVLLVVTVFCPDSAAAQFPSHDPISEGVLKIAEECRNTAGEQASLDLMKIPNQWETCTRITELYGEIIQENEARSLKETIEKVCQKKDELLRCSRQSIETLKRCLNEDVKEEADILFRAITGFAGFLCRHTDEIAEIVNSPEETVCIDSVENKLKTCANQTYDDLHEIYFNPRKREERCKLSGDYMTCINGISGKCADSRILKLLNSLVQDELLPLVCPQKHDTNVADTLAKADTFLNHLKSIILALAVPYILHL